MKKFCSKCGSQLDLGKKACTVCHAFNPFFIAGYASSAPDETVAKVEKQEESVITKEAEIENNGLLAEQLEREKNDLSLKNELLRVKEETEQYKKETLDLVKGVKKELEDIDKENKLLKERVEQLNSNRHVEVAEVTSVTSSPVKQKSASSGKIIAIAAAVTAILIAGFSYFLINGSNKTTEPQTNLQPVTSVAAVKAAPTPKTETRITAADTTHPQKLLAAITPPAEKPKPVAPAPTPAPAINKPAAIPFSLNATRVIGDLVGKKLSGCDITINSASEIDHVDNLVLVEKLSAFYLKYKCTVKIKQGTDTYTASPYMYYSAEGTFIKVDGTNCE
jgi:type VII secretion protein EssA